MNQKIKVGFWKRQYSEEITISQIQFDVIFGIIAPILCLLFDPAVFRSDFIGGSGYLSDIQLFAYLAIGLGIIALTIWGSIKLTSRILISAISGVFFAGALLALALGIVLLPMSLLGLMGFIGIFGFTPFLTAFVYLRNGIRALRKVQTDVNKGLLVGAMLIGISFVVGIPAAINWKTSDMVSNSIYTIIHSEKEDEINSATNTLKSAFWCSGSCYDEIVWAYADEENETKRKYLEETYLKLTGENIEQRLWLLSD